MGNLYQYTSQMESLGTWMNPSDSEYQSTFQTEFPEYIYRPTGYDPYPQTDQPARFHNSTSDRYRYR
jgi:hypothetical protein